MYRVTDMGSGIYAAPFNDLRAERESIEGLLEAGDHVLLVNDLQEAADVFGVEVHEIIVVEPE
jgi:hypothetical protein